jgi:predicted amidohydrolase
LPATARGSSTTPERAREQGADLLLTPELALCGYPPEDLLLRDDFLARLRDATRHPRRRACRASPSSSATPRNEGAAYNAATLICDGARVATYYKQRLPSYEVFDEERYFDSGEAPCVLTLKGVRCGVNICADVWEAGAADLAREAGAELLLVLNASPYHIDKRERPRRGTARAHRCHRSAGDLRQPRRRAG